MLWEAVFMLLVLKLPIVYLCLVVWWAIRAEPRPEAGATLVARVSPTDDGPCDWRRGRDRRLAQGRPPLRPLGGRAALARAEARR